VDLDRCASFNPLRPLGVRHLANHQIAGGNLIADVLELRLARFFRSLSTRLRHLQTLLTFLQIACFPSRE